MEVKVEPSEVLTVTVDPNMVKSEPPDTEGAQDISPSTSNKVSPAKLYFLNIHIKIPAKDKSISYLLNNDFINMQFLNVTSFMLRLMLRTRRCSTPAMRFWVSITRGSWPTANLVTPPSPALRSAPSTAMTSPSIAQSSESMTSLTSAPCSSAAR